MSVCAQRHRVLREHKQFSSDIQVVQGPGTVCSGQNDDTEIDNKCVSTSLKLIMDSALYITTYRINKNISLRAQICFK